MLSCGLVSVERAMMLELCLALEADVRYRCHRRLPGRRISSEGFFYIFSGILAHARLFVDGALIPKVAKHSSSIPQADTHE